MMRTLKAKMGDKVNFTGPKVLGGNLPSKSLWFWTNH